MERPGDEKGRGRRTDGKPEAEVPSRTEDGSGPGEPGRIATPGHRPLVGPYTESPKRHRSEMGGDQPLSNRDRADLAAIRHLERQKAERLQGRDATDPETDTGTSSGPGDVDGAMSDPATERRRRPVHDRPDRES